MIWFWLTVGLGFIGIIFLWQRLVSWIDGRWDKQQTICQHHFHEMYDGELEFKEGCSQPESVMYMCDRCCHCGLIKNKRKFCV